MAANKLSICQKPIIPKPSKTIGKHVEILFNISSIYQNNSKRNMSNSLQILNPSLQ